MAGRTLYEKLGGYNAISALVDGLMRRMGEDARLSKYFIGHGENSKKRLRQLQVEMICEAAGGPCFYTGRDMKIVHKGLGINGEEWQIMLSNILNLLETFKFRGEEQKGIMEILSNLKKDIVEKP